MWAGFQMWVRSRTSRRHPPILCRTTAVRRWWIEALEWQRDPARQRDFLARMERYLAEGPPGSEHRITREEFRAQLGV